MKTIPRLALLLAGALAWGCSAAPPGGPASAALIGRAAPEVTFAWLADGSTGSLADLRGRVVLLEFWRTWCGPCLQQVPRLNDIHERYEADGLVVLGVTGEELELVRAKVEEAGLGYPVALLQGPDAEEAYGITAVPRAFLVDREGELVWVGHPGTLEEGRLRELLFER